MIYPKPKNKEEEKEFHRLDYELQKKGLIEFHKSQGYDVNTLNIFLVNSLKKHYEEKLKEDGLLTEGYTKNLEISLKKGI